MPPPQQQQLVQQQQLEQQQAEAPWASAPGLKGQPGSGSAAATSALDVLAQVASRSAGTPRTAIPPARAPAGGSADAVTSWQAAVKQEPAAAAQDDAAGKPGECGAAAAAAQAAETAASTPVAPAAEAARAGGCDREPGAQPLCTPPCVEAAAGSPVGQPQQQYQQQQQQQQQSSPAASAAAAAVGPAPSSAAGTTAPADFVALFEAVSGVVLEQEGRLGAEAACQYLLDFQHKLSWELQQCHCRSLQTYAREGRGGMVAEFVRRALQCTSPGFLQTASG
jgi:hypothetical protein